MIVLIEQTLNDGSIVALTEFATNQAFHHVIRLVKLKPGLTTADFRRIDQRSGGIQLVREWPVNWTPNPGPRSRWMKIFAEGKVELEKLVASHVR